jgi:hypothetical protein
LSKLVLVTLARFIKYENSFVQWNYLTYRRQKVENNSRQIKALLEAQPGNKAANIESFEEYFLYIFQILTLKHFSYEPF